MNKRTSLVSAENRARGGTHPRNSTRSQPINNNKRKIHNWGKDKKDYSPTPDELERMAKLAARLSKELAITAAHDRSKFIGQDPHKRQVMEEIARCARERQITPIEALLLSASDNDGDSTRAE